MTRQRRLIFSLGLALTALFAADAKAQVSAYAMVALSSYGFSSQGNAFSFATDTASFGGGAFYNFPIHSRLSAGIDGRVLYGPALYGGTTADAALRIGFIPTRVRLRPYFEIGGGLVSAVRDPGFDPQRFTNGALELLGGLDIRITDSVDLRAIEYGAAAGASNNGTTSAVAFLDSGIVYHSIALHHPARRNPDLDYGLTRLLSGSDPPPVGDDQEANGRDQ